jgi:hypothetical protein
MTVLTRSRVLEIPEMAAISTAAGPPIDIVDQWGMQSFPASDPPANW